MKAAPWTAQFSSGSSTVSRVEREKMCTFSGQAPVLQGERGDQKSWLPGAMNTGTLISPSARARAWTVS